jgi:hypothetical protein
MAQALVNQDRSVLEICCRVVASLAANSPERQALLRDSAACDMICSSLRRCVLCVWVCVWVGVCDSHSYSLACVHLHATRLPTHHTLHHHHHHPRGLSKWEALEAMAEMANQSHENCEALGRDDACRLVVELLQGVSVCVCVCVCVWK